MKENKEPTVEKVELTKEELVLLQNLLYANRWTIQESEQTIKPLINKLASMVDGLK
jgi:hypothetical protein